MPVSQGAAATLNMTITFCERRFDRTVARFTRRKLKCFEQVVVFIESFACAFQICSFCFMGARSNTFACQAFESDINAPVLYLR